jgi:hypothetical protein
MLTSHVEEVVSPFPKTKGDEGCLYQWYIEKNGRGIASGVMLYSSARSARARRTNSVLGTRIRSQGND